MKMDKKYILSADVGTSSIKAGIFDKDLNLIAQSKVPYKYISYGKNVEMEADVLFNAFIKALKELSKYLEEVAIVGFSVLCPGLFCLDEKGDSLRPAIIHLDRRSEKQGLEIAEKVGEEKFLEITGNLPIPGGMSVTSIEWIRQNEPAIFEKTYKFGHTNTMFIKKLTGTWGIDPTNASFVGLYETIKFGDWSRELCEILDISIDRLPKVIPSGDVAGCVTQEAAKLTGLKEGTPVLMGAADTASATYGMGMVNDGNLINSTGTVEVMVLVTDKPQYRRNLLLRTHVIPGKWIMMNIIGAGGESLNWFYDIFCKEMEKGEFFDVYLPAVLEKFESNGVTFTPHLAGYRNSIKDMTAIISGLKLSVTRESILYACVEGLVKQLKDGMETFREISNLDDTIHYTGGGSGALKKYKEKIFSEYKFKLVDSSAMLGAAKLASLKLD